MEKSVEVKLNELYRESKIEKYADKIAYLSESKNKLNNLKAGILVIKGLIVEEKENKTRRKKMAKIFKCGTENVAASLDDLIELKGKTKYYANDFTYSAVMDDNWLKNIKVIWGNANLCGLDDINKLKSLEYITGQIYYKNKIYTYESLKELINRPKQKIKR